MMLACLLLIKVVTIVTTILSTITSSLIKKLRASTETCLLANALCLVHLLAIFQFNNYPSSPSQFHGGLVVTVCGRSLLPNEDLMKHDRIVREQWMVIYL